MTQPMQPEIKAMRAIGRAFDTIPKEFRFRLLAYFTAREQGVGSSPESGALYALAYEAKAKRRRSPKRRVTPRAKDQRVK